MRKIPRRAMLVSAAFSALLLVSACGDSNEDEDIVKSEEVDVLYNKALASFADKKFKDAVGEFEEVERQHPYSEWATRGQVMAAYSAYLAGEYDDAVGILDRFVKLHPTHPSTPYAYYMKALCYYTQINDIGRDQKVTEEARAALREVMSRYPESDYAQDAKLKLDLTEDHLAGKEMEIGRYYLQHSDYVGAINRFKYVLDHYQTTSHTAEALHRLVESYLRLGVLPEAKKYAAVLGYNFPGSDWYKYSYAMMQGKLSPEEKKSFLRFF
jgi:outer membrane protein assembly factor BamD